MDSTLPADDAAPELFPEMPENAAESSAPAAPDTLAAAETAEPPALEGEAAPAAAPDELAELVAKAEKGRLSPADEERAAQAIKRCLLDGRAGVATALEVLPKFAWMVAVNGVVIAWPELTAGFRTQLFSGLAKDEGDAARRLRLSLARGLLKQDAASALKLAVGVAKDFRDKESGVLAPKDAQMFANVFIGRAKPWLAALPLAELKPADADSLVQCALFTAFFLPHPPVTQLGIIKWAAEAGRLTKLPEPILALMAASLGRWTAKWQNALRTEVPALPEEITSILPQAQPPSDETPISEANSDPESAPADERAERAERDDDDDDDDDDRDEPREGETSTPQRQYPVYVSRTMPTRDPHPAAPQPAAERGPREREPREQRGRQPNASFNLQDALRQIDQHVTQLRNELKVAQNKGKDDDRRPRRNERAAASAPIIPGEPTVEELSRLNHQLEARNGELQQRVDELTSDAEDRAASSGIGNDQPAADPETALRGLLVFKLKEDYEDFVALEREAIDIVVQQHYRTLLSHIFEVLIQEGVALDRGA